MTNSMHNPDRSNSVLTAWIARWRPENFFLLDLDAVVIKRSTDVVRFIEYKHPEEPVRDSQKELFDLLSRWLRFDIDRDRIRASSGCYVVRSPERCFEGDPNGGVTNFDPDAVEVTRWRDGKTKTPTRHELLMLIGGRPTEW